MSRCSGDSFAADVVAQQLGALANRRKRSLELVGHVAQEAILLLLEVVQTRPQPFEPLSEVAQILRPVDLDRVREIGSPHLADRLVELPDRARDQDREQYRERERDAGCRDGQVEPLLAALRRDLLQPQNRAIGQVVGRRHRELRGLDELRVSAGELRLRVGGVKRRRQQPVEAGLVVGETLERRQLVVGERQRRELLSRLQELLPYAPVIVEQRAVLQDQVLADDPLQRRRLLDELPAGAPGLRRLLHGLLALRLQLVERQDELRQRVDQRQADQQEPEQDELEKRSGVIHGGSPL